MEKNYDLCWLPSRGSTFFKTISISAEKKDIITETLKEEALLFFSAKLEEVKNPDADLQLVSDSSFSSELDGGFQITMKNQKAKITAFDSLGLLYGLYELIRRLRTEPEKDIDLFSEPQNDIRMINHWDNFDGSVERGYAGKSIFFNDNDFSFDPERIEEYARFSASIGINAISINNVNVRRSTIYLIQKPALYKVKEIGDIFRRFGIKIFLSINYASPVILGGLSTADPLDSEVQSWWNKTADEIYSVIPYFGGFVVKADSEGEPGPFTYNRNHDDGANLLGKALAPHNGLVIWRCFVYNSTQDWRDRTIDRARAAYDIFKPLDGKFMDNVALQIKFGPIDFQIREPVSPLLGGLSKTKILLEFQVTQEYTGQQRHICYLPTQWKEVLDFDTYANGEGSYVADLLKKKKFYGIAAINSVGMDANWTGHKLAQANLYGYGRLCWNPSYTPEELLTEWLRATFSLSSEDEKKLFAIMIDSRQVYENYTVPLGVGFMCTPHSHYGPNIDGYEYDRWGTYHFADKDGIGNDRTCAAGSGYTAQYPEPLRSLYENVETCPDDILLFFHHVPYTHILKSGKNVLQHIYDTHFEGFARVEEMVEIWKQFEGKVSDVDFENITQRLNEQLRCAREWKDQVNTYFQRKTGVTDEKGRLIYK